MESPRRKRKGSKSSCSLALRGDDEMLRHKKSRRSKRGSTEIGSTHDCSIAAVATGGAVMTAPPSVQATLESPTRGVKRKVGCIDTATRIGRKKKLESEYEIGAKLGQGKFGTVHVCRRRTNGEEFACKVLPKIGEECVHREVEIMQHLSGHPGIVTLTSVFEGVDSIYMVMELCHGGRLLDQLTKEGKYSERRAAEVVYELMSVIKYCHEMGVVHRDVKPENILITKSGKIKLADFGLAARIVNGQSLFGRVGSPGYVAPEVLHSNYSEKVDIWSAGVLLHALLMGCLPFRGDSLEAVFKAIENTELKFDGGPWDSVSVLGRDLLSGMLCRDVSLRLTAGEVLGHPWILLHHADGASKAATSSDPLVAASGRGNCWGSSAEQQGCYAAAAASLERTDEVEDELGGSVDALAAAITRMRISEPKRSRVCYAADAQNWSSNLKSKLCTAF